MSVSPEVLRTILRYDAETGRLFWLPRPVGMFSTDGAAKSWNSKFAGKEAFTFTRRFGYREGGIFNRIYLAHRVIWALQTGQWPIGEIDHADGDGANNAWNNLRLASRSENTQNTRRRSDNTSGAKGVDYNHSRKKWRARINVEKRAIHLGRFSNKSDAEAAVAEARARLHGQFARM